MNVLTTRLAGKAHFVTARVFVQNETRNEDEAMTMCVDVIEMENGLKCLNESASQLSNEENTTGGNDTHTPSLRVRFASLVLSATRGTRA